MTLPPKQMMFHFFSLSKSRHQHSAQEAPEVKKYSKASPKPFKAALMLQNNIFGEKKKKRQLLRFLKVLTNVKNRMQNGSSTISNKYRGKIYLHCKNLPSVEPPCCSYQSPTVWVDSLLQEQQNFILPVYPALL